MSNIKKRLDTLTDCQVRSIAYEAVCALLDIYDLHVDEIDIDEDKDGNQTPNRSARTVQTIVQALPWHPEDM